ncbi:MAG TPA: TSUP family transporter [Beijerinckiaceae bacterium]
MEFLTTPDIGWGLFAGLTFASFITAFIGVFTGTAGGLILLALMASVMPPAVVVPVHTVVQLGSGVTRTLIMWRWVMHATLLPFLAGAAAGALVGARVFVALPTSALMGILSIFILIVTWLPKLGRMGAQSGRFAAVGFAATFLGVFVSATGTLVAPFVASAAADRRNHAATVGALMTMVHVFKLLAFGFIGFSIWPYALLMAAMIATGAAGNWVGELALNYTSEQRFRLILQIGLTLLALRLLWKALADAGWF